MTVSLLSVSLYDCTPEGSTKSKKARSVMWGKILRTRVGKGFANLVLLLMLTFQATDTYFYLSYRAVSQIGSLALPAPVKLEKYVAALDLISQSA